MTISVPCLSGDATARIQRALDDCFLAGGGTVALEPGIHRTGGLRVRSRTTFLLRSGAVLEASRDPSSSRFSESCAAMPWTPRKPSIRFEDVEARGVGMSLCAYGDEREKLSLSLSRCRVSFAAEQREFVRAAHLGALELDDVAVDGVDGPLARSWGDVATPAARGLSGVAPVVEPAEEPFSAAAI